MVSRARLRHLLEPWLPGRTPCPQKINFSRTVSFSGLLSYHRLVFWRLSSLRRHLWPKNPLSGAPAVDIPNAIDGFTIWHQTGLHARFLGVPNNISIGSSPGLWHLHSGNNFIYPRRAYPLSFVIIKHCLVDPIVQTTCFRPCLMCSNFLFFHQSWRILVPSGFWPLVCRLPEPPTLLLWLLTPVTHLLAYLKLLWFLGCLTLVRSTTFLVIVPFFLLFLHQVIYPL